MKKAKRLRRRRAKTRAQLRLRQAEAALAILAAAHHEVHDPNRAIFKGGTMKLSMSIKGFVLSPEQSEAYAKLFPSIDLTSPEDPPQDQPDDPDPHPDLDG